MNAPGQRLNFSDLTFILWKDSTSYNRVEHLQAYVIRNAVSKTTLELMQKHSTMAYRTNPLEQHIRGWIGTVEELSSIC